MGPSLIVVNELLGCQIADGTARPLLMIFPSAGFNHEVHFPSRQKPVLVQTFILKLAIEALDQCVLHRLPWLKEKVIINPLLSIRL